jgi:hypothetical protein
LDLKWTREGHVNLLRELRLVAQGSRGSVTT